ARWRMVDRRYDLHSPLGDAFPGSPSRGRVLVVEWGRVIVADASHGWHPRVGDAARWRGARDGRKVAGRRCLAGRAGPVANPLPRAGLNPAPDRMADKDLAEFLCDAVYP